MGWKDFASTMFGDVLTFLADVIGHVLSWPVVVLVIVLILLKPIRKLIGRLKNAKGLGGELEFEMNEIERSTDEAIEEAVAPVANDTLLAQLKPSEQDQPSESEVGDDRASAGDRAPNETREDDANPKLSVLRRYLESPVILELGADIGPHASDPHGIDADPKSAFGRFVENRRITADPSGAIIAAWEQLLGVLIDVNMRLRGGPGRPTRQPRKIIEGLRQSGRVTDSFLESVESLLSVRNEVAHGQAVPSPGVARTYVARARMIEEVARSIPTDPKGHTLVE